MKQDPGSPGALQSLATLLAGSYFAIVIGAAVRPERSKELAQWRAWF